MKKRNLVFLAISITIGSSATFADGECEKYRTSYDQTFCMSKIFIESDKELNSVYINLRTSLKESTKQQLKDTQLQWIKYRDVSCESNGSIDVSCNYQVNHSRSEYLRDRLRECKAGTCRDNMIIKKSWN